MFESRQDDIAEVNEKHDEEVIAVSKKTVAAALNNEAIKNQVIGEVVDVAIHGGDVIQVLVEAELPFGVDVGGPSDTTPDDKLAKILQRTGENVDDVKNDPEFDAFLDQVVGAVEKSSETRTVTTGPKGAPTSMTGSTKSSGSKPVKKRVKRAKIDSDNSDLDFELFSSSESEDEVDQYYGRVRRQSRPMDNKYEGKTFSYGQV